MNRIPSVDAYMSEILSLYSGRDMKEFEAGQDYDSKTLSDVKHRLKNLKLEKEGTIKWLSVGVGEGRDLEVLHAKGLRPIDVDFYGIDTSNNLFERVRESASRLEIPEERMHLEVVSAEKMDYVLEFDLISVVLVLHEVDPIKLPHTLRNILRALRKDGTLVITDFQRPYELEKNVVVWDFSDIERLLKQISPKTRISPEIMDSTEFPEEFGFYSCIVKSSGGISPDFYEKFEKNTTQFIRSKIDKTRKEKEELENEVKKRVDAIIGEEYPNIDAISQSDDKITRELEERYVMKLHKVTLLRNQLEYLNEKFQELVGTDFESPISPPDNDPVGTYVESIKNDDFFRYITNPMVSRSIPLESLYVKLAISGIVHDPEHRVAVPNWATEKEYQLFTDRRYLEKVKEEIDPEKAVEKWQRIVILGDPGSGKTTLLKYLTLEAANGRLKVDLVPFFITLGEYADPRNKATSLIEFACEQYRKRSPFDDEEFEEFVLRIRDMNERRKALFLLDGFDEIPHDWKLGVSGNIERELNRYVLSSRQVGYTGGVLNDKTLEVVELSDPAIQEFIQNWTCSQEMSDHEKRAKSLIDHIQIPRLKMLARNPLLLSIQCFVYQSMLESGTEMEMPTRRVDLYRESITGLLKTLERRGITYHDVNSLDRRISVNSVFADMAFHYFEEVENAPRHIFRKEELNECLRRISRKLDDHYADLLSDVVFRSEILHPLTMYEYHFLHLTFQEYYTAYHLANQEDGIKTIAERKRDRHWQEIILLYAGMKSERFQELIDLIWGKGIDEDLFYNNLFLIGRCLAEVDIKRANIKSHDIEEIKNQILELSLRGRFDMWRDGAFEVLSHVSYKFGDIEDKLIENLKDDDIGVKTNAANALRVIGGERVIEHLIPLLKDDDSKVRRAAVIAVSRIGAESAIEHLIPLLNDDDSDVAWMAANALGRIRDESAIEHLIPALNYGYGVRHAAASALGRIGDKSAIEHLIPLLKDYDYDLRRAAANALGWIGDENAVEHLIPMLKDDYIDVGDAAAIALREIGGERAVEYLIPLLKDDNLKVKRAAEIALGIEADKAIDPLIPLLKDENHCLRQVAALKLGWIGDDSAVEHLIPLLKDEESFVRRAAASALGRIEDKSAIEHLIPLLDDDDIVRPDVVISLGRIGDESAIEHLIPLLKDDGFGVKEAAAEALKHISEKNNPYIPMSKYTDL